MVNRLAGRLREESVKEFGPLALFHVFLKMLSFEVFVAVHAASNVHFVWFFSHVLQPFACFHRCFLMTCLQVHYLSFVLDPVKFYALL